MVTLKCSFGIIYFVTISFSLPFFLSIFYKVTDLPTFIRERMVGHKTFHGDVLTKYRRILKVTVPPPPSESNGSLKVALIFLPFYQIQKVTFPPESNDPSKMTNSQTIKRIYWNVPLIALTCLQIKFGSDLKNSFLIKGKTASLYSQAPWNRLSVFYLFIYLYRSI